MLRTSPIPPFFRRPGCKVLSVGPKSVCEGRQEPTAGWSRAENLHRANESQRVRCSQPRDLHMAAVLLPLRPEGLGQRRFFRRSEDSRSDVESDPDQSSQP